jgi:hypothetical protein
MKETMKFLLSENQILLEFLVVQKNLLQAGKDFINKLVAPLFLYGQLIMTF